MPGVDWEFALGHDRRAGESVFAEALEVPDFNELNSLGWEQGEPAQYHS